jgi:peptidoglycan hydrolase-like protein with peptidoglycan-binding domain
MVVAVSALMIAGPAQAGHNSGAYGTNFVDGGDALHDDFGDHRSELGNSLCYGCADSWNTDLVIMWQTILYAEGLIGKYDIDGEFGPQTRDATIRWQSRYGLAADGVVGSATWGKADNLLAWYGDFVKYYAYYDGDIYFIRGGARDYDNGAYELISAINSQGDLIYFDNADHRIHFYKETFTIRR